MAPFEVLASMAGKAQGRSCCRSGCDEHRSSSGKTTKVSQVPKPQDVEAKLPDPNAPPGKFKATGGSNYDAFNEILVNQVGNALRLAHSTPEMRDKQIQGMLATLIGLKPQDEAEGMLIAQMIACHNAAIQCFRRAMLPEQSFEGRQLSLNYGNKLCRTYALHLEVLDKHRGKGQQK